MGLQKTLKALSDPIRREILNLLKKGACRQGRSRRTFPYPRPRFRGICQF